MTARQADDERFAELLRVTVPELDVHLPPIPREEMWTRIVAQRHGHALLDFVPAVEAGEERIAVSSAPVASATIGGGEHPSLWRRRSLPVSWAVPLVAAVLVMGVVVGVQISRHRAEHYRVAATAPLAQEIRRIPPGLPAQLVTQRHFREVKRLLNTFAVANRNNEATPQVDAHMAAWARNLLATTQLLLDSPAGMDPQRRQLLTDIEMVLVQVTQLAPDVLPQPQDRGFVQQSIQRSQVLKRLQAVIPSGVPNGI